VRTDKGDPDALPGVEDSVPGIVDTICSEAGVGDGIRFVDYWAWGSRRALVIGGPSAVGGDRESAGVDAVSAIQHDDLHRVALGLALFARDHIA
jgi:hypothetical protein